MKNTHKTSSPFHAVVIAAIVVASCVTVFVYYRNTMAILTSGIIFHEELNSSGVYDRVWFDEEVAKRYPVPVVLRLIQSEIDDEISTYNPAEDGSIRTIYYWESMFEWVIRNKGQAGYQYLMELYRANNSHHIRQAIVLAIFWAGETKGLSDAEYWRIVSGLIAGLESDRDDDNLRAIGFTIANHRSLENNFLREVSKPSDAYKWLVDNIRNPRIATPP